MKHKHSITHANACGCVDCRLDNRRTDTGNLLLSQTSGSGKNHRKARCIECNGAGVWLVHFSYTNGDGGGYQALGAWNRDVSDEGVA